MCRIKIVPKHREINYFWQKIFSGCLFHDLLLFWFYWIGQTIMTHRDTALKVSGERRGQHRPSQLPNPLASLLPPGCSSWCGAEPKRHNVGYFLTRLISSCSVLNLLECSPDFIHSIFRVLAISDHNENMQVRIELLLPVMTTFFVPSLTPTLVVTFFFMILVMLVITIRGRAHIT